jgi:hypothetical protein
MSQNMVKILACETIVVMMRNGNGVQSIRGLHREIIETKGHPITQKSQI